ncbi:MAG: hypothetical protein GY870_12830 [archaeon]|nr:hypothetical protein [archaeon]
MVVNTTLVVDSFRLSMRSGIDKTSKTSIRLIGIGSLFVTIGFGFISVYFIQGVEYILHIGLICLVIFNICFYYGTISLTKKVKKSAETSTDN